MKFHLYIILCFLVYCSVEVIAQDSLKTQSLDEVIVKLKRGWIENGVINVIPNKKEKQLANSPSSLIKMMHLPFVKEKDGKIVTASGEVVQIFVNGEKADKIDVATFWPKDVKRVQYIENPQEPKYEGNRVVIDFIMPKYEYGGVTKADVFQKMPNYGSQTIASKLVHGKMSYGVIFTNRYYRDHRTTMTGETKYSDIFYDGEEYDEIVRTEQKHSYERTNRMELGLNAKYTTDKKTISHTFSLVKDKNPGSGSSSENNWTDNLFESSSSSNYATSKTLSPEIMGKYYFRLADKWHLTTSWTYSYANNKASSWEQIGNTSPIYNDNDEDVHSGKISIVPTFVMSDKWSFQLKFDATADWFSTLYGGSVNERQRQSRQEFTTLLRIGWTPSKALSLILAPGFGGSLWQIDDVHEHTISPIVNTYINWNPNKKLSFSGRIKLDMWAPSASESNPIMVKNTELLWTKGNPDLKTMTSWNLNLASTYMPNAWLSFCWDTWFYKNYNERINIYTVADAQKGGVVKEIINAKPSDMIMSNFSISGSFFDNNLSVSLEPNWFFYKQRGEYGKTYDCFRLTGSADYTLGDVNFSLEYEGPLRDISSSGMASSWQHDAWKGQITYGHKNLHLLFMVEDIFNNKARSWEKYVSPNFSTNYNTFETGRRFSIGLTYTFSYGKKVDTNTYFQGHNGVKTSVM